MLSGAALFDPVEAGNSPLLLAPANHEVGLDATNANGDTALYVATKVENLEFANATVSRLRCYGNRSRCADGFAGGRRE